jgi:membrane protein
VSLGAAIATGLWLIASALFSLYVGTLEQYNQMYGSVGAMVVVLVWLLLGSYALLIGAEINAESERQDGQAEEAA